MGKKVIFRIIILFTAGKDYPAPFAALRLKRSFLLGDPAFFAHSANQQ